MQPVHLLLDIAVVKPIPVAILILIGVGVLKLVPIAGPILIGILLQLVLVTEPVLIGRLIAGTVRQLYAVLRLVTVTVLSEGGLYRRQCRDRAKDQSGAEKRPHRHA
jgi:hypothetical protein